MVGRRKPIVLPVPVRAWAMLQILSISMNMYENDTYISVPWRATLIVFDCTSVMVA